MKSEQSNFVNQYNVSTGEVDCMDQNISTYMINLHTKMVAASFLFVVDVAINSAYQRYLQSLLNPREYRLDALSFW